MKRVEHPEKVECPDCSGAGEIVTGQAWSDGMIFDKPCARCESTGEIPNELFDPTVDECEICGDGVPAGEPCSCDDNQESPQ